MLSFLLWTALGSTAIAAACATVLSGSLNLFYPRIVLLDATMTWVYVAMALGTAYAIANADPRNRTVLILAGVFMAFASFFAMLGAMELTRIRECFSSQLCNISVDRISPQQIEEIRKSRQWWH